MKASSGLMKKEMQGLDRTTGFTSIIFMNIYLGLVDCSESYNGSFNVV